MFQDQVGILMCDSERLHLVRDRAFAQCDVVPADVTTPCINLLERNHNLTPAFRNQDKDADVDVFTAFLAAERIAWIRLVPPNKAASPSPQLTSWR